MNQIKIDPIDNISQFKMIAQGNTAEVYSYEENKILKLFRENMPKDIIMKEYEKAKCIHSKIKNTPKTYGMVSFKKQYGIIYEQIIGIDMIKIMLKNVFRIKKHAKYLANIHFELHENHVDLGYALKNKLETEIDAVIYLTEEEKNKIKSYVTNLPDSDIICHFDFHPGNIIMQDNQPIIIDWMTACAGDSNADVARTYLLMQYGELQHVNWVVKKVAHLLEKYIGRIYIKEYKQCKGILDNDYKQWLLPVATARLVEWISDTEKEQLLIFIKQEMERLQL